MSVEQSDPITDESPELEAKGYTNGFVCPRCGCLVADTFQDQHQRFHARLKAGLA